MIPATLQGRVIDYMTHLGYDVATGEDEINIVYIEGVDKDGKKNTDKIDFWNDRRLLIRFENGVPVMLLNAQATTEPGLAAVLSKKASFRGGCARIAFGQYTAWRMGFHRQSEIHPALVQVREVPVYRDLNRDGRRTNDRIDNGIFGINQHSTKRNYRGGKVATWSEGCLVGMLWKEHLDFIRLLKTDPRYIADPNFVFTTTVINGHDLFDFVAKPT